MAAQVRTYYKTKAANAVADDKTIPIPAGKTVVIKAIDYTCPTSQNAGVKILVGSNVISAAQSDKYVKLPPGQAIDGPKNIIIRLDNSNNSNGAFLGATIYYE